MRILGIDPGYALVGFGVIDYDFGEIKVVDYGVIETHKDKSVPERLVLIEQGLAELIEYYKPDEIAIEEIFYSHNQTTFVAVAQARGVIINYCQKTCGNLFEYTPMQIKQAITGYGRAGKRQVQYMTATILGLDSIPKPDDAADALAVAICHSQTNKQMSQNQI